MYQVNMLIYNDVIVKRVNPQCMFFECFRGKLFENRKRYTKSETMMLKALKKRIPNHILHVYFERKITSSQSNLLDPVYGVYDYVHLPKTTEMPKRIKMLTSKWHQKQQHFFTHHFRSLQCIRFVEKKCFGLNKLTRAYLMWGKGGG